MTGDKRRIK